MLTAEFKVNGCLIGHFYIINEEHIDFNGNCLYSYEFYYPDKEIKKGKIIHKRSDDFIILIEKVIKDIKK